MGVGLSVDSHLARTLADVITQRLDGAATVRHIGPSPEPATLEPLWSPAPTPHPWSRAPASASVPRGRPAARYTHAPPQVIARVPSQDVSQVSDRLVLRPSNGVLEASDYLSHKHDWVQLTEEVTAPLQRSVYTPPTATPGAARVEL